MQDPIHKVFTFCAHLKGLGAVLNIVFERDGAKFHLDAASELKP